MFRALLFIVLLLGFSHAKDYKIEAEYEISYAFLGAIGTAQSSIQVENGAYKIKVEAKATGVAKMLSSERVEIYESTGIVEKERLVPQIFISSKKKGHRSEIKRYLFDHKLGQTDILATMISGEEKRDTKTQAPFYAKEDILTLFFNLKHYLGGEYHAREPQKFVAIGANDTDGVVDIKEPLDEDRKMIASLLEKSEHLLTVVLNQRIFSSQKGEMFINLNDKGICTSAVLKDVVMFGDLKGTLKNYKFSE